jgi:hypothetical protein
MTAARSLGAVRLEIQGIGIILYSPFAVAHIDEGADYLSRHYSDVNEVSPHIREGTIVGFGTGSPGTFTLQFYAGYPDPKPKALASLGFKLRLGVQIRDRTLCIRDLYDLLEWAAACPAEQTVSVDDGFYHVTLCGALPRSGILGDDQTILVYLNKLDTMPALRVDGVPTFCS